ncbi:MAG: heme biosynthesis HemY N-terminal domain-containing protein [Pseudomonadota bacterium]
MLWSLFKVLAFFCAVAALALGAGYLLEADGGVMITVGGTEYPFGPLQSVIALTFLVLLVWLLLKLMGLLVATWRFMNGDETAISRYFARNRQAKGFNALAEGMMALASGEGRLAMSKAAKADKYLDRPELTLLLTAQAAEVAGDRKTAEVTYRKLVEDPKTRFVGVRGILKQKLAEGDTETAMQLAQKAFALKPAHTETGDTLLQLQAQSEDWKGARDTLNTKLKQGDLPRDVHRRRDAVLALSEAWQFMADGDEEKAHDAAIAANKLSPDFVPAAALAARAHTARGNARAATKVIKAAWAKGPHPDLAAAFAEIQPDETADARMKRFAVLTKQHANDAETRMLLAELHIAAEDFPGARRALGDLMETDPTMRSATLMAAIERGEGADDQVVKAWLARALTLPRGPQWICELSGRIYAQWQPVCDTSGGFDTLTWKRPPETDLPMPTGAEMLPLIVGPAESEDGALVVAEDVPEAEVIDSEATEPDPQKA